MKWLAFSLILFSVTAVGQQSEPSDQTAKAAAASVEQYLAKCSPRIFISASKEKKKRIWVKETFGPPSEIDVDVKKNDSILYPYLVIADFTIWLRFSDDFPSKDEAMQGDADNTLLKSRNRNVYLLGSDSLRLKSTDVSSGRWVERPRWDDACWDHISTSLRSGN